jgi:hypothetical protein
LVDKPWLLSMEDIANLTDRQIIDIYYRERDKDGIPKDYEDTYGKPANGLAQEEEEETVRIKYFAMGHGLRIPEEKIEEGWQLYLEKKRKQESASHG